MTDNQSVEDIKAKWSSGVPFYPPSARFWRIGGKWYDFERFCDLHPGGREVLELCRDRYEDCTFVFESHHHNYKRARAVISRYEVTDEKVAEEEFAKRRRPEHDKHGALPPMALLGDDAFYSVLRRRVLEHLQRIGMPSGGPTWLCVITFWTVFCAWIGMWALTWLRGTLSCAFGLGLTASWVGAFGHNWVHQVKYKNWAYLSLDLIGFSSDGWFREHNLQHHMYTNTPWDNHFKGTDPFLVTDPTVPRAFLQRWVLPYLNPIILSFGLPGNYIAHSVELIKGNEKLVPWKLALPTHLVLFVLRWGWWGLALSYCWMGTLGIYYFSMALMNHNSAHTMDVAARNKSQDWGEAQLHSSADWGTQMSFLPAGAFLWLNYHTVHHLFPKTDFSHHRAIQAILLQTCKEFGITYETGSFLGVYREMLGSFASPRSLLQELVVYSGAF